MYIDGCRVEKSAQRRSCPEACLFVSCRRIRPRPVALLVVAGLIFLVSRFVATVCRRGGRE